MYSYLVLNGSLPAHPVLVPRRIYRIYYFSRVWNSQGHGRNSPSRCSCEELRHRNEAPRRLPPSHSPTWRYCEANDQFLTSFTYTSGLSVLLVLYDVGTDLQFHSPDLFSFSSLSWFLCAIEHVVNNVRCFWLQQVIILTFSHVLLEQFFGICVMHCASSFSCSELGSWMRGTAQITYLRIYFLDFSSLTPFKLFVLSNHIDIFMSRIQSSRLGRISIRCTVAR